MPATPKPSATTGPRDSANHDTRVTMVQERLLEALLLSPPAPAAVTAAAPEAPTATGDDGDRGRSTPASMEVDVEAGVDAGGQGGAESVRETADDEAVAEGCGAVPTVVQVVVSMVDSALQVRDEGCPCHRVCGAMRAATYRAGLLRALVFWRVAVVRTTAVAVFGLGLFHTFMPVTPGTRTFGVFSHVRYLVTSTRLGKRGSRMVKEAAGECACRSSRHHGTSISSGSSE